MKTWLLQRYVSPVTVGPEGPMADEASAAGQGTRPTNVFGPGDFQERMAAYVFSVRMTSSRLLLGAIPGWINQMGGPPYKSAAI